MELGGPRRKSRGGVTRLGYGKGMMQQLKELDAVFFCADCNANGKDRRVTLWVADTCGLRLRRPLARAGKTPQESAAPLTPFPPRTAKEALNKRAETAGAAARLVTPNAETPTQKHCAAVKRDGFHVAKRRAGFMPILRTLRAFARQCSLIFELSPPKIDRMGSELLGPKPYRRKATDALDPRLVTRRLATAARSAGRLPAACSDLP